MPRSLLLGAYISFSKLILISCEFIVKFDKKAIVKKLIEI